MWDNDDLPGAELSGAELSGADADGYIRAAMRWHFDPETGSPFWLAQAASLGFDPREAVRSVEDLRLFPTVVDQLRNVRPEHLIPRGYGDAADIVGVYDSGGTTGAPKRVVFLDDWLQRMITHMLEPLDRLGIPLGLNWLGILPTGPHAVGHFIGLAARARRGLMYTVDMDPRWVRKLIASGQTAQADAYVEHLVEQSSHILLSQEIGVLMTTPPMLERLARRDDLLAAITRNVRLIMWGGAHMDADTHDLFRNEVFPGIPLHGVYGSTMIMGGASQRLGDTEYPIFDGFGPHITFRVVDPVSLERVPYGTRGQVVTNHVSRSMLLPNNLDRDTAIRVPALPGQPGDSLGDLAPVQVFGSETVIEGVY
ncbi:AMP-binding protein [Kutzneria sp. NPDC051319]|uniref:AMP-binding protein n=1 Tax=Kutzneria sp. NPDC051319 TaxID=3155047 RepID=UPI003445B114